MDYPFGSDEYFMQQALGQAAIAGEEGEIPVGAIIVSENKIIAKAYNQTEKLNDVTAHAEILALTSAFNYLGAKYLPDCKLYVTLEPCTMCAGALYWSQIGQIIIGARDERRGFARLISDKDPIVHPKTIVTFGVLEEACGTIVTEFFEKIRRQ